MKYLIDYRYKVVHSIKITVASILSICARGHSADFSSKFDLLTKFIPELEPMMTTPFNEKMIDHLKKLQTELEEFLLLPEDLDKLGNKIIQSTKKLLTSIDPFHFSDEESPNIRRSQIVELSQNLQIYLQRHILSLQGKASSLIDEKEVIQDILTELSLISLDPFDEKERKSLNELFATSLVFDSEPTLAHVQILLHQAVSVETTFKSSKSKKK